MKVKSSNPYYHITYWIFVILVLTLIFGRSWGNSMAALFFITMLLPIVLGTSYFFNYILVPRFFMKRKWGKFTLFTLYTIIISLYLESIVIVFSFIYLGNFSFHQMGPNASDSLLLAVVLYLLVFLGSFLLMARQIKEKQYIIQQLMDEKEKMEKSFLEIRSNRRIAKIPYKDIVYIESLTDHIIVNTLNEQISSKEKISKLNDRLPDSFIRIHRSFIINKIMIKEISYDEVVVADIPLNIGRSYRKMVKEAIRKNEEESSPFLIRNK